VRINVPDVDIYEKSSKDFEPCVKSAVWWWRYDRVGCNCCRKRVEMWFDILMHSVPLLLFVYLVLVFLYGGRSGDNMLLGRRGASFTRLLVVNIQSRRHVNERVGACVDSDERIILYCGFRNE
jgi:hypothetical protein